jgi:hypothetical protein
MEGVHLYVLDLDPKPLETTYMTINKRLMDR